LEQYFVKHGKLPRDFFALEPEKKMGRFTRAPADQIVHAAEWNRNTLLILMERFINMCGGEDAFRSYLARLAAGEEANDA
jgi:hypothetical protein